MAKNYEYIVPVADPQPANGDKPSTGTEYRNVIAKDGPPSLPGVSTLFELFQGSVKKYGNRNCLGVRKMNDGVAGEYVWETYSTVGKKVEQIGSALATAGIGPKGRCGIYGANCPEWMITMQACNRMSVYSVPLYDSLGENAIDFIIKHAECSIVFVSAAKLPTLGTALKGLTEFVKTIVYWGAPPSGATEAVTSAGVALYSFDEFLALGEKNPPPPVPPAADDLTTIMYTSGTTGDPKGVMLTHRAVVSTIASGDKFIDEQLKIKLDENDVFLSYLPLAHILDRVAEELFLYLGAQIGYWQGDIKMLVDDIGALKPTYFAGVPRVFERIYGGVMDKVKAGGVVPKFLFNYGFSRKLHFLKEGRPYDKASPFFDSLVFSKIKERLGGRVRLILSGGAPLAPHVEEFLKVTMCCPVVQGYGLTETCAASFIGIADDIRMTGTVGPPLPVLSFRLESVPEMNYDATANPPRGEVCIKGPCTFSGYYKQDDKTKEVLEDDGWFHTGDIGEITPEGALRIFDRKKNIFKLSQGEYIAVEKVEEVYKQCADIEQVWVYGNSFESCLVGVVVPKEAFSAQHTEAAAAKELLLEEMTKVAKANKLKGFEIVKAIHLESTPWTPESDLLTPTFKMKRPLLQKKYQKEIDQMYAQVKET